MATKRDLVEAYSFSRRRLVTAFVSGAPGGREVEPTRPGRTIVGGLALAVLLVAGAAIAGVFSPKDPSDWNQPGLIVSKETGAAYVILEESDHPVLRPVINITSARLILDTGAAPQPRILAQATIDAQTIGEGAKCAAYASVEAIAAPVTPSGGMSAKSNTTVTASEPIVIKLFRPGLP